MSDTRFIFTTALLSSVCFSAQALALTASDVATSNLIYTHTYTSTPSAEPAASFAQLDKSYILAGVCFLGFGDCGDGGFSSISGDDNYTLDTAQQCQNEGFAKQNCNSVQQLDSICPYNTAYAKGCKCMDNLVTCSEWQKGVGESCNEQYASCVCLDGVPAGQYGCAEYYPSPCSSVCKKAYTDNCHIRSDNNSAVYGCMKYWSDCSSKCETPYPDNCRNQTAVISSCPANATCQYFSDCSSKISSWSCNDGYNQSGNSCVNLCEDKTAVTVPANATCSSYYSDCSSKCSAWACNNGYQKSGDRCILKLPLLYGDGTVSYEPYVLSGKTPIGIVLNTSKRLAMALTDVRQDGSPGSEYMSFSEKAADTALYNCQSAVITCLWYEDDMKNAPCEKDGKSNTNIILSDGRLGKTYAASAANAFEPAGCTQSFCRRGNWFLPVIYDVLLMWCHSGAISAAASVAGANPDLIGLREAYYTYERFDGYTGGGLYVLGYWSSTEKDAQNMWYHYRTTMYQYKEGDPSWMRAQSYVRPFIKYQLKVKTPLLAGFNLNGLSQGIYGFV